ncbi:MAG: PstS family phosphate ABC transporter substrate-binding protein [Deltaproteobacteria bacterium]|nr:PstS family phosphate ABC transporter substrate-binding protein [Deltaproteobacteria bacterium]
MRALKQISVMAIWLCFPALSAYSAPASTDTGVIKIDGSSTLYPITEAVAEEFGGVSREVKITVGVSGTGGGFKQFCSAETDISDASRPIKAVEVELCAKNGISYVELPVAFDALTVVVNPQNDWATSMTVAELKKLWEPAAQGKITHWNQIRGDWPSERISLFAPGVDSGTFDYFTEVIVGEQRASRGDITTSEDDNILVQGVANDKNALGFFGFAYYIENVEKLKAVAVDDGLDDNGKGPQLPSLSNVEDGIYQPLARPLFIYVRQGALDRRPVSSFVSFYLNNAAELAKEVGYVPLPQKVAELARKRLEGVITGSVYATELAKKPNVSLADLMLDSLNKQ